MNHNRLFSILGINSLDKGALRKAAECLQVSIDNLKYYNDNNILPASPDLERILESMQITKFQLMLEMGIYNQDLKELLSVHSASISQLLGVDLKQTDQAPGRSIDPVFSTELGKLYQGDCIEIMREIGSGSINLIFADPPFNLNKLYPSGINDDLKHKDYISWCEAWLEECIRILAPGGSLFLWNLPKWNTYFAEFLNSRLVFRHWIATDIKYSLPIQGRLYPSHYSLLYYCKGNKPSCFHADRLPMEICPKCKTDLKDYGGYKDKMNPNGINLTDVWNDIPPVRHNKYKKRKGANELSIKLLDRIIEMASNPGDIIFDPFGGSGSTYITAELKGRKWLGVEIGPIQEIIERFLNIEDDKETLIKYRNGYNKLFTEADLQNRKQKGMWTHETFIEIKTDSNSFENGNNTINIMNKKENNTTRKNKEASLPLPLNS
jgi:site-specific DNA-methyltransferase (adenine-specific)